MEDVQVLGVSKSNDGKQAQYWATDPKAGCSMPCSRTYEIATRLSINNRCWVE